MATSAIIPTTERSAADPLFSSWRIGRLVTRNRFVRSATAECLADDMGRPPAALADLYRHLAEGEVGLIITGHAYVDRGGKCHPGMTSVDRDDLVSDLSRLADYAHAAGAKIALQINHGGANCDPAVTPARVSASARIDATGGARALTTTEIAELVASFARAAVRARAAGFDAVQIHAAHGYLVSQFLSPATNRRADEYGGNIAGRSRFLQEIAREVRRAVGPDFPLLVKLGLRDYRVTTVVPPEAEASPDAPPTSQPGLTAEDGLWIVSRLADWGFDAVEISNGFGDRASIRPAATDQLDASAEESAATSEAPFLDLARRARQVTGLPIMLVNGLRSHAAMSEVIESGAADFVSLCRPLIAEPDLVARMRRGESDRAACRTCDRCWPEKPGQAVACRNAALSRA